MGEEADCRGSFHFSNIGYNHNNNNNPGAHHLYTCQHQQQPHGYLHMGMGGYPPFHGAYPSEAHQSQLYPPPQPQQDVTSAYHHGNYPPQGGYHHGNSYTHGGAHTDLGYLTGGAAVGVALYGVVRAFLGKRHGNGGRHGACSCGHGCGHHHHCNF